MISQSQSLFCINQSCHETVRWTIDRLSQAGLQVLQTFDLGGARAMDTPCSCPHHGTDRCDCQMIILLVYGKGSNPVSLIVHGYDGKTWLSLVETFHANNAILEAQIRKLLVAPKD